MKITEYLGYHMHTTLFGIEISKKDSDVVLTTCDRLEQAVIWIEKDIKEKEQSKRLDNSTIDQEEG